MLSLAGLNSSDWARSPRTSPTMKLTGARSPQIAAARSGTRRYSQTRGRRTRQPSPRRVLRQTDARRPRRLVLQRGRKIGTSRLHVPPSVHVRPPSGDSVETGRRYDGCPVPKSVVRARRLCEVLPLSQLGSCVERGRAVRRLRCSSTPPRRNGRSAAPAGSTRRWCSDRACGRSHLMRATPPPHAQPRARCRALRSPQTPRADALHREARFVRGRRAGCSAREVGAPR